MDLTTILVLVIRLVIRTIIIRDNCGLVLAKSSHYTLLASTMAPVG